MSHVTRRLWWRVVLGALACFVVGLPARAHAASLAGYCDNRGASGATFASASTCEVWVATAPALPQLAFGGYCDSRGATVVAPLPVSPPTGGSVDADDDACGDGTALTTAGSPGHKISAHTPSPSTPDPVLLPLHVRVPPPPECVDVAISVPAFVTTPPGWPRAIDHPPRRA